MGQTFLYRDQKTAVTIAIHLLLRQNENFKANSLFVVSQKMLF